MEKATVINLLTNSGLNVFGMDDNFIYFRDPSCIFPAFDSFFDFAWIVALIFTAIMLFGWGVLYIKNGININSLFNNAKTLILIFCIFSLTKPIVNAVYGDNLFAKQCETKQVSLSVIQELLDEREKRFGQYGQESNFEVFSIVDSGVIISFENTVSPTPEITPRLSNQNFSASNVRSIEYVDNATIYILSNGDKIKRSGGSVAWRNNNPGNIRKSEFARNNGAVGETDKWAVFPDETTGLRAIVKLLRTKNYANLSIRNALRRWAPSSDGNNPDQYAKTVSKITGFSMDAYLNNMDDNDLMKIARAMQTVEGWTPGIEQTM